MNNEEYDLAEIVERDIKALHKYARLTRESTDTDEFHKVCRDALIQSITMNRPEIDEQKSISKPAHSEQTKLLTDGGKRTKGVGHISGRTMSVEIENAKTKEVRPARLTSTGILFDEMGVFDEDWFVINPVGRNVEDRI